VPHRFLIILLLVFGFAQNSWAEKPIPEACQTQCVSNYGLVLGKSPSQVEAYSNCNANCVVFQPNHFQKTYTGIKWQCVEYARRWLLVNMGVVYGDVDIAADIWKLSEVTHVSDQSKRSFPGFVNGSTTGIQKGDLLIYGDEYLKTGHVAVVTQVDAKDGFIYVAEQNFLNETWPGDYARKIKLHIENGKHWVLDSYLIGWKRVKQS